MEHIDKKRKKVKGPHGFARNLLLSLLFSFLIMLLGVVVIFFARFATSFNNLQNNAASYGKDDSNLNINDLYNSKDVDGQTLNEKVTNILLLGVDAKVEGQNSRSDSMIVMSINWEKHNVKATSLMRDSYVTIEKPNSDGTVTEVQSKLGHAHSWGGPELTIKTINKNFNLNIRDYVEVDFTGLRKIIDIMGGIRVDVDDDWVSEINKYIRQYAKLNNLPAEEISGGGTQTLSGMQAVSYARIRHNSGNDMARTERQRIVLQKLFEKLMKTSVWKYEEIFYEFSPYLTMSYSAREALALAYRYVKDGTDAQFAQARFPMNKDFHPSNGQYINGTWYLTYDVEETNRKLFDFIFNDIDPETNDGSSQANSQ